MPDLTRAVDAELAEYRPPVVPPFDRVRARSRRRDRRRRAALFTVSLTTACGVAAVVLSVGSLLPHSPDRMQLDPAIPGSAVVSPPPNAQEDGTDRVDGVLVGGLPDGWQAAGGAAPAQRGYGTGTRTRHDLTLPPGPQGERALKVLVFRATGRTALDLALRDTYAGRSDTVDGNEQQGVVRFGAAPSEVVGYKQVTADVALVVIGADESLLPGILESARLAEG